MYRREREEFIAGDIKRGLNWKKTRMSEHKTRKGSEPSCWNLDREYNKNK